jgi:pterin-4a-carbinolamine dehydratase
MNQRLVELALKRQRLQLRAGAQRLELRQQLTAYAPVVKFADQVRAGIEYVKHHPHWLVGIAVAVVVARPRRAFRWLRRGFVAWQLYRRVRAAAILAPAPPSA